MGDGRKNRNDFVLEGPLGPLFGGAVLVWAIWVTKMCAANSSLPQTGAMKNEESSVNEITIPSTDGLAANPQPPKKLAEPGNSKRQDEVTHDT